MKRYTIRLQLPDEMSDVNHLRKVLSDVFSSTTCLTNIAQLDSDDGACSIRIESEAKRRELVRILEGSQKKLGISAFEVGWGWDTTDLVLDVYEPRREGLFGSVEPQVIDAKEYRSVSNFLRWLATLPMVFLVGIGAAIVGLVPAHVVWVLIPGTALAIGVWFYWLGPALPATSIWCDRRGLNIKPLLRPLLYLTWDDICGIKVRSYGGRSYRGLSCHIQTYDRPNRPSAILLDIDGDGLMFIKTVIVRASLRFVEGVGLPDCNLKELYLVTATGYATYKRFDAE